MILAGFFYPEQKAAKLSRQGSHRARLAAARAHPGLTHPVPGTIANQAVKRWGTLGNPCCAGKPAWSQQAALQHS